MVQTKLLSQRSPSRRLSSCFLLPRRSRVQAPRASPVSSPTARAAPTWRCRQVSSPAPIESIRTTMTDEQGEYLIVELSPGSDAVRFTRQAFASFRREEIESTSSFNAAVDAELRVGTVEDSVTITGAQARWSTPKRGAGNRHHEKLS